MPFPRGSKPTVTGGSRLPKLISSDNKEEGPYAKRSTSPSNGAPKKRTAFIDITNAHKVQISLPGRKKEPPGKKQRKKSVSSKNQGNVKRAASGSTEEVSEERLGEEARKNDEPSPVGEPKAASQTPPAVREVPAHLQRQQIPEEFDIDSENADDCFLSPGYAKDIFDYLKKREEKFVLIDYMAAQPSLNTEMRAILVDWLVEVQENFELYHETLYLAVKMTDHFLARTPIHREQLQLVGSTTMLIASKFEEHCPPRVDDFLYICDDAYKRDKLIAMEANILETLSFDINIPIPYRFLRRYAKCANASMETLTLARYFCESSLLEMELVVERSSLLASACLLMALVTKDLGGWSAILEFHSGYRTSDLAPVVRKLHGALSAPPYDKLKAIKSKYSHTVFFEVASVPLVDSDVLEKALSQ